MAAKTVSSVFGVAVADELAALAIDLVCAAPSREGQTHAAKIPWSLIRETRDALDRAGIEWKSITRAREERVGKVSPR